MSREAWRDFICSPHRAGRHLSFIGQDVTGATGEPVDLTVLEAFLQKLRGADDDVVLLSDAVDLLTGGYDEFIERSLPGLLDAMTNEILSKQTVVGPGLRGNPMWARTILGRLSGTISRVHFLSRTSHRSYDLPENRLLRCLVAEIEETANRIVGRVGARAAHPTLLSMLVKCRAAAGHHAFGEIAVPSALTGDLQQAAARHRRPEYRKAAALASRRKALARGDDEEWWNNVLSLLSIGWLEPLKEDRLFELFVLVLVMDVIEDELAYGDPVEVGLVTADRRHVALFERGDASVRVYFNQSPSTVIGLGTRYAEVLSDHIGISGRPRRPDIILVAERAGLRRLIVIEVKDTDDRSYLSDSVYKVFGYMHDFAEAFADERGFKAILMVPENVTRSPAPGTKGLRVASAAHRADVADALKLALA